MHGLKASETELSFLNGALLQQVSVGQNELIMGFDNDAAIAVMSEISISFPNEASIRFSDFSSGASAVCALLGRTIESYSIEDHGKILRIVFDGAVLRAHDNSVQFESFVISFKDKFFVA